MSNKTKSNTYLKNAQILVQEQGCWYCNLKVSTSVSANACNYATWDHVTPKSLGGSDVDNRVIACPRCNNEKRDMRMENYRAVLKAKGINRIWGDVIQRTCTWEQYDADNSERCLRDPYPDHRPYKSQGRGCSILPGTEPLLLSFSESNTNHKGQVAVSNREQSRPAERMDESSVRHSDRPKLRMKTTTYFKLIAMTALDLAIGINGSLLESLLFGAGIVVGYGFAISLEES